MIISMDIALVLPDIIECIKAEKIIWRNHMLVRMRERGIRIDDVFNCIKTGKIIEQYPTDYPFPSCLIHGFSIDQKHLHLVCALGESKIWMITSYYPSSEEWLDDFESRRR